MSNNVGDLAMLPLPVPLPLLVPLLLLLVLFQLLLLHCLFCCVLVVADVLVVVIDVVGRGGVGVVVGGPVVVVVGFVCGVGVVAFLGCDIGAHVVWHSW